jgi:phospholipid/cholesterol/gamma-HCH transport system substrate-binding protein
MIPPGGKIKYTQSSVSLENLIGQMIFSAPGGKKGEDKPAGGEASQAPVQPPGGGAAAAAPPK